MQDHGPINTWNRAAYLQSYGARNAEPTTVPLWTTVRANLIMNGPSGNRDLGNMCVRACVRVCVRACERACVCERAGYSGGRKARQVPGT